MQVKNKTIIVTGGGSGIGRALVLQLVRQGVTVAAADINEETLHETKRLAGEHSDNISIHVLNIADREAVERFVTDIIAQHNHIDGVINNAGIIQPFVRIRDLDYEAINRVMQVNFYGMLYMTKALLPHLQQRPEAHIVNVSSMGGFLPVPGQSVYGASKAAVKLFTEGLASELAGTTVQVSVVFPGATQTNITKNSGVVAPMAADSPQVKKYKSLPAEAAAQIIIRGMEQNKTRIYVGKDSKLMNWLYRLSPSFATNLITKKMKSLLPE